MTVTKMEAPQGTTSTTGPKMRKNASKKNKKSWRKNTDIADIEEFLDEKRFEERVGGSFEDRPDEALFVVDTSAKNEKVKNKRKEPKPLRCFANLEGIAIYAVVQY